MMQLQKARNGVGTNSQASPQPETPDEDRDTNGERIQKLANQLATFLEETLKAGYTLSAAQGRGHVQDETDATPVRSPRACGLSGRQLEILRIVAEGMSNKEIASLLHVSDQTIKNHMTHILTRLQANDRTHAVVLAYRLGMLDL